MASETVKARAAALRRRVGWHSRKQALQLLRRGDRQPCLRLGSDYGGWWIPDGVLHRDSVVYLAGAGEDISFDLAVIATYDCQVVSVDPTPRAVSFVTGQDLPEQYHFLPVGLGGRDRVERFYAPRDVAHVSHSITNLQGTEDYFEATIVSLRSLLDQRGHSSIDLLKVDIEGAEHELIDHLVAEGIFPKIFCMEADQPTPLRRTRREVETLRRHGYRLVHVEDFNLTFARA